MDFERRLLSIQQVRDPLVQKLLLGEALLEQQKPHLAELCFDQLLKEVNDTKLAALARIGKGKALRARGLLEAAHSQLAQAVEAAAAAREAPILLLALTEEADTWSAQGRPEKALRILADGYRRITSLGDAPVPKAHIWIKEGLLLHQLGRLEEALSRFQEAERILSDREEEKPAQEAQLLCLLGQADVLVSLGQAGQALSIIHTVKENLPESSRHRFHQTALEIEAKCYDWLGNRSQATSCREQLAAISKKGSVYAQLALTYFTLGEPERAKEWERKALEALNERENIETRAALFRLNMQRGQIEEGARHLDVVVEQTLTSKNEMARVGCHQLQVSLWVDEAKINVAEETAAKVHERLLRWKEKGRDDVDISLISIYQSLGIIRSLKGQGDEAESLFRKALHLAHQVGTPLTIGHAMANLGRCLMGKGDLKAAKELLARAAEIIGGSGEALPLRYIQLDRVRLKVLEDQTKLPEAIERVVAMLEENARFQCPRLDITGLMTLGWFHWRVGRYQQARDAFRKAMEIAEETGMELKRLFAMGMLGLLEHEAGNKELAEQWLGEALEGMELRGTEVSLADALAERFRDLTGFP